MTKLGLATKATSGVGTLVVLNVTFCSSAGQPWGTKDMRSSLHCHHRVGGFKRWMLDGDQEVDAGGGSRSECLEGSQI